MDVEFVESSAISPVQLEAWSQLFDSVPDARFYHYPHWYQCISEHLLPEHLNLGFLTVDNQLQMVLPLCFSAGDRHRTHPVHDHLSLNEASGWKGIGSKAPAISANPEFDVFIPLA